LKIVVLAFNRQEATIRCLQSVVREINGCEEVTLLLSCDGGHALDTSILESGFERANRLEIRVNEKQLGLKEHVHLVIEMCAVGSQPFLILEDDLVLIPGAMSYACRTLELASSIDRVAQISLYNFQFNEIARCPTYRPRTAWPFFLCRQASSWGFLITPKMARQYLDWYEYADKNWQLVPDEIRKWPASSWKKEFDLYIAQNRGVVIAPYQSFALNMGDTGFHKRSTNHYTYSLPANSTFVLDDMPSSIKELLVLDEYLEIEHHPSLAEISVCGIPADHMDIDFYGLKTSASFRKNYVLTTVPQGRYIHGLELFAADLLVSLEYQKPGHDLQVVETSCYRARPAAVSKAKNLLRSTFYWSRKSLVVSFMLDLVVRRWRGR